MLDIVNIVTDILSEQDQQSTDANIQAISDLKDKIHKDISKIEVDTRQNATLTNLASRPEDLISYYLIELGKHYLGKYDSRIAAKRQDDITAKYVDVGHQIFLTLRTIDKNLETKITDLKTLKDTLFSLIPERQQEITPAINIINTFANTPLESYQCKDPLLKSITTADNLSNVSLQTLYTKTIYGAVYTMLERRAGALKATLNQSELKKLLLYPGAYSGSMEAVPEPLQQTLADNSMYSQRIQAIGVAAIEYYKYLVNQQNLIIKQQHQDNAPKQEQKNIFDYLSREILKEDSVGYSKAYGDNFDSAFSKKTSSTEPQDQKKTKQTTNKDSQRQQYTKVDLFNPQTWKRDSNFERIYLREYDSFLTNGTSKYIPGKEVTTSIDKIDTALSQAGIPIPVGQKLPTEYEKPMVYTLDTISKDPSNQARTLIEAFRLIAEFTKTKKTLMQRVGQVAAAAGALRVGMGPVN
jgi:hypothetical protein